MDSQNGRIRKILKLTEPCFQSMTIAMRCTIAAIERFRNTTSKSAIVGKLHFEFLLEMLCLSVSKVEINYQKGSLGFNIQQSPECFSVILY